MVFAPDIDAAAAQNYESKGGFFKDGERTNKKFYEDLSKNQKKKEREKTLEIIGKEPLSAVERFKKSQGMTDKNPFGSQGFFTRVFGINPNKLDYSKQIPSQGIQTIIESRFNQFIDPFQSGIPDAGQIGTERGALKKPIKKGQMTGFGIAGSVPRQQSGQEVLARALFSKASPLGLPLAFLDTKEQMIEGSPEFTERLSEGPQGTLGYLNRAVSPLIGGADIPSGITSLKNKLKNFFTNKDSKPQKQNKEKSASEFLIDYYKQIENRPPATGRGGDQSQLKINEIPPFVIRSLFKSKGIDLPQNNSPSGLNFDVEPFSDDKRFNMEFKMPLQDFGLGSLMNFSELYIDDFNNDSLRRILNKGLDNPGSLFGRELELFELMRKNQKLGIPNFAVDGPVII